MQITQLALPFPAMPLSMNNRGMARKSSFGSSGKDDSIPSDEPPHGELTRTSERRRGTFERRATSGSQRDPNAPPLTAKESAQKLRNKALRLLTTREHSRAELMRKLSQAKARVARRNADENSRESNHDSKDDIEKLVDDLAAQGWQSDDRYAEAIVRRLTGQAARRYISEKLAQAGIKKEVAQLAMEAIEQDDADIARALWDRRFGDPPKDDKERQRQVRYLLSRGFHLEDAFKIIPKVKNVNDRPN
jgi:regulatory protein